jgi:hypothetical protein
VLKTVTVYEGQTLLDIVIQEMGSVDGLLTLAAQNGIADALALPLPGTVLTIPALTPDQQQLVAELAKLQVRPTSPTQRVPTVPLVPSGINYMKVTSDPNNPESDDFIVS